jgi:hypothetical protein
MTARQPIPLTYVTAPRCGFCTHGRGVLAGLAEEFPLTVREVALDSPEGRAVAARWRVPYPPIVLVDGRLAGYGRLSTKRLRRLLTDRQRAQVAS